MIKLRLKKYGRKGQPCYRIVAMDSRVKRDGKSNYLKYLPHTWNLIQKRLKNPVFKNFNLMLKKYLNIIGLE